MTKYLVWNPEKIQMNSGERGDTLASLRNAEAETGGSLSSEIDTTDINAVLTAMNNECDVTLNYREIPKSPFNVDVHAAIDAKEWGDVRSLLDEDYWPLDNGDAHALVLSALTGVVWEYNHSNGWVYDDDPLNYLD